MLQLVAAAALPLDAMSAAQAQSRAIVPTVERFIQFQSASHEHSANIG